MSEYRMVIRATGGPKRIERESISPADPGPGEVRVRQRAIGVNFIDTYVRSGLYPAELPSGLGTEAVGLVEACGPDVIAFSPGDRVAYATGPLGAYASVRNIPADHLVRVPDSIADDVAAASLLKGMTAAFLIGPCAQIQPRQSVLVHAAAGGVGSLLVQWLHAIGAVVIAHAGSADKAAMARANGADYALHLPFEALGAEVKRLTGGEGVDVILDGVGKASWDASLASVKCRGLVVTFGNASGPVPPFSALALRDAGSIFVTRPTLADYTRAPDERRDLAGRLFAMIADGRLKPEIGQTYPLDEAAQVHADLEARRTTGSTVMLP